MSDCGCGTEQAEKLERKTLVVLLAINAVMFAAEMVLGWLAQSTGLIADSLDMLADAGFDGAIIATALHSGRIPLEWIRRGRVC